MNVASLTNSELCQLQAEISAEMARRLQEKNRRLARKNRVELYFADNVVKWDGGEVKLTPTSFDILSAIWNAKKHRIKTVTLCEKVWGDGCTSNNTLYSALQRLNNALNASGFPLKVKSIKGRKDLKTSSVIGYGMR